MFYWVSKLVHQNRHQLLADVMNYHEFEKVCSKRISKFPEFQFNKPIFLSMIEEKGHFIAQYGPQDRVFEHIFGRGMGIAPPENSNVTERL